LECGDRSISVPVMGAKFKIPCRHDTLYSVWHKTKLLTHRVIELEGSRGWEFHDPDFRFCVPRPMSLRASGKPGPFSGLETDPFDSYPVCGGVSL
jgi:hypothetical protein